MKSDLKKVKPVVAPPVARLDTYLTIKIIKITRK